MDDMDDTRNTSCMQASCLVCTEAITVSRELSLHIAFYGMQDGYGVRQSTVCSVPELRAVLIHFFSTILQFAGGSVIQISCGTGFRLSHYSNGH
jgi:hypothetical protein